MSKVIQVHTVNDEGQLYQTAVTDEGQVYERHTWNGEWDAWALVELPSPPAPGVISSPPVAAATWVCPPWSCPDCGAVSGYDAGHEPGCRTHE